MKKNKSIITKKITDKIILVSLWKQNLKRRNKITKWKEKKLRINYESANKIEKRTWNSLGYFKQKHPIKTRRTENIQYKQIRKCCQIVDVTIWDPKN